jgi:hypothetical protein
MRSGSFLEVLRRGRASFAVAILYVIVLPILLGLLPKPAATAEFLLLRALATGEICSMPGSGPVRGQPMQHQPDCILCSTACPYTGSAAAPPAEAIAEPFLVQLALAVASPRDFALPALRLFTSGIQSRGPPLSA